MSAIRPAAARSRTTWRGPSRAKVYPGFPHGMATTHAERINRDLLAFVKR